jgi:hypothetical protein
MRKWLFILLFPFTLVALGAIALYGKGVGTLSKVELPSLPNIPTITFPWQKCDGKTEVEVTLTEALDTPSSRGCAKGRWWVVRGEVEIIEKNLNKRIVTLSPPEGLEVQFWHAKPGTGTATIKVVYSD